MLKRKPLGWKQNDVKGLKSDTVFYAGVTEGEVYSFGHSWSKRRKGKSNVCYLYKEYNIEYRIYTSYDWVQPRLPVVFEVSVMEAERVLDFLVEAMEPGEHTSFWP